MNRTPLARFVAKVTKDAETGCWTWTGTLDRDGYGRFYVTAGRSNTTIARAHRWSYLTFVGPIPEDLQLDHLCRNRACVNPAHLEPVTLAENLERGAAVRTHCKNGHLYDEANTYVAPDRKRVCRACRKASGRRYWHRKNKEDTHV